MKNKKVSVSISLDQDILQLAKEYAEKDYRTLSQYINYILKIHFFLNSYKNSNNR